MEHEIGMSTSEELTVTGSIEDELRECVRCDEEVAKTFIKDSFLSHAVDSLFHARNNAGLSLEDVAAKLGVTPATIKRMEANTWGSITLTRYMDWALACGVVPQDFVFKSVGSFSDYALSKLCGSAGEAMPVYNPKLTDYNSQYPLVVQDKAKHLLMNIGVDGSEHKQYASEGHSGKAEQNAFDSTQDNLLPGGASGQQAA